MPNDISPEARTALAKFASAISKSLPDDTQIILGNNKYTVRRDAKSSLELSTGVFRTIDLTDANGGLNRREWREFARQASELQMEVLVMLDPLNEAAAEKITSAYVDLVTVENLFPRSGGPEL